MVAHALKFNIIQPWLTPSGKWKIGLPKKIGFLFKRDLYPAALEDNHWKQARVPQEGSHMAYGVQTARSLPPFRDDLGEWFEFFEYLNSTLSWSTCCETL